MKNISKIFILTIISLLVFSCNTDEGIINQNNNIENLKKDAKFIEILNNKISTIENISDIEKVNFLIDKKDLNEKNLNELAVALGFSNIKDYSLYIENETKIQNYLENEFNVSNIKLIKMEEIVTETLNTNLYLKQGDPCNCERTRRNCIGIATSASIVGNLGCASLDLAIIPGIICHAAVLAGQYFASDNCNASAENCVNNCNN